MCMCGWCYTANYLLRCMGRVEEGIGSGGRGGGEFLGAVVVYGRDFLMIEVRGL
jgi:hypothetical protein